MKFVTSRLFSIVSETTRLARANAASTAALSPIAVSNATLSLDFFPDRNRARHEGGAQIGRSREDLIVDFDRLRGIARLRRRFRDDESDGVADMLDNVHGENRACARHGLAIRRRSAAARGTGPGRDGTGPPP